MFASAGAAGLLLARATPRWPACAGPALALAWPLVPIAALYGQTPAFVLLLAVGAWRALDASRDRVAGVLLAWLTMKPQLAVLVVPGVLLWSAVRRRWSVPVSFAVTLAGLALICSASPRAGLRGWLQ